MRRTTKQKDFHQELEDDIEIAADLKEKVNNDYECMKQIGSRSRKVDSGRRNGNGNVR